MAQIVVMAIFDVQAQTFHRPVFVPSRGVGVRMTSDEVNRVDPGNVLAMHPEDHRLFELGTWDESTGLFLLHNLPELVADCHSLRVSRA